MDIPADERLAALIVANRCTFGFHRGTCQTSQQHVFLVRFLRVFDLEDRSPLLLVAFVFHSEYSVQALLQFLAKTGDS